MSTLDGGGGEEYDEHQEEWKELKSPYSREDGEIKLNSSCHRSTGI
jgi:hypothetical protein